MVDGIGKLRARLRNYGYWLMHEMDIGPKSPCCISIESRHIPDTGEVWSDDEPPPPCPDVADAEAMHKLIRQLDRMQQYAIAVEYGGTPCVMRFRRVGAYAHNHILEIAERLLDEMAHKGDRNA